MGNKTGSSRRVAGYRLRMRAKGMRSVQIWVPDVRAEGFARAAHVQSAAVAASEHADVDQDFVDAIAEFGDEDA